ncbi:MAG: glycoside hydrolase family 65 protein, partial [Nanoarchaeota archaeon]
LIQEITVKDDKEQLTRIKTTRFASMNDAHTVGQKVEVTPLTYDAKITIQSLIDADVINNNVARYRQLKSKHLTFKDKGKTKDILNVQVQTTASKHDIVYTAKNAFSKGKKNLSKKTLLGYKNIGQEAQDQVPKKTTIAAEKLVTIYTSRESENPLKDAEKTIDPKTFTDELKAHKQEWKKLWKDADVSIKGDIWTQQVIRLHIYHLLSTASPHNKHLDAGMPARGLVGEGYRGHIFWDTLYVLPFFGLRFPEIAQALLKYRYRRIAGAERYAQEFGYDGAMYPWQTADSGDEETQTVHYNPNSKTWGPDMSSRQRHVSIAIFVNFWRYYKLTDDVNFLREYGTDVMLQIARFWASIAQYDKKDKRYHIEGVMGPDEFHEKLPRSKKPGVKDNTYTNLMVSWLLEKTITLAEMFPDKTLVSEEEIQKWKDISNNLNISIRNSILEQFVGYFKLPELDWKKYEKKYGDIHRMDRILKAEGKSPDSYKVTKQADVLMPYFVLDINEVTAILRKLGVNVSDKQSFFKKNYRYYEKRTSHGSTLSKIVHGIISSYMHDDKLTWSFFNDVLVSDVSETIRKDSAEGIHTGLMAGTVDYVVRRFAGVNYQKEQLEINPKLPKDWEEISFRIQHRGVWYDITVTQKKVTVATSRPATLIYRNSPWKVTKSSSKAL